MGRTLLRLMHGLGALLFCALCGCPRGSFGRFLSPDDVIFLFAISLRFWLGITI